MNSLFQDSIFPRLPGSHLKLTHPALEFVKSVCKVKPELNAINVNFSMVVGSGSLIARIPTSVDPSGYIIVQVLELDSGVTEPVKKLRRNLLKLLNIGEFDAVSVWKDPCISFILPEVIYLPFFVLCLYHSFFLSVIRSLCVSLLCFCVFIGHSLFLAFGLSVSLSIYYCF